MQKKYRQITAWLTEEIEKGTLCYGERIPSEKELAEQFGVSRQTVRRALKDLNPGEQARKRNLCVCEHPEDIGGRDPDRRDADICGHIYFSGSHPRDGIRTVPGRLHPSDSRQ